MNASLQPAVVAPAIARPIGETLVLAGIVALIAWALPTGFEDLAFFAAASPAVVAAVLIAGLAPAAYAFAAQTVAMGVVFVGYRVVLWDGPGSWGMVVAPLVGALALWALPVERVEVRKRVIVLGTAAMLVPLFVDVPNAPRVVGATLQSLVLVEYFGRRGLPRRPIEILRCMGAANATAVTPLPPEDLLQVDRSRAVRGRGLLWLAVGLAGLALSELAHRHAWIEPWRALGGGHVLASLGNALAYWACAMGSIAGIMFVDAGLLGLLGVPVRAPIDAPWKATSFLDYWRRANVFRYKMLNEVYFRNFFPTRGKRFPLGVLGVFLVSGLHHVATARFPDLTMLRWGLEGVAAAGNAELRERRARASVRAFIAGVKPAPARFPLLATLGILLVHGYLMDLARPDGPTRRLFEQWASALWASL